MNKIFSSIAPLALFVFLACLPLSPNMAYAQSTTPYPSINWLSFEDAQRRHQTKARKWMIYIYGDVCPACRRLNAETLSHPAVAEYANKYYYAVKFNAHQREPIQFNGKTYAHTTHATSGTSANELAYDLTFNQLSYPQIIILDEQLNNLQPAAGFRNLDEMMRLLQFFGEDFYKWMDWSGF